MITTTQKMIVDSIIQFQTFELNPSILSLITTCVIITSDQNLQARFIEIVNNVYQLNPLFLFEKSMIADVNILEITNTCMFAQGYRYCVSLEFFVADIPKINEYTTDSKNKKIALNKNRTQ